VLENIKGKFAYPSFYHTYFCIPFLNHLDQNRFHNAFAPEYIHGRDF